MSDNPEHPSRATPPPLPSSEAVGATRARPRRKKRTWLILVLAIPGGLLAIVGAVALLVFSAREMPVTSADEEVLVSIADLAEFVEGFVPDGSSVSLSKLKYLDGSIELSYEYDSPDEDHPYLSCTVGVERSAFDARTSYLAQWPAMMVGIKIAADTTITVEERGDLLRWGDASRFGILKTDGQPFGNLFLARKGRLVATVVIAGVYFEDTAVEDLILPRLVKLASYRH